MAREFESISINPATDDVLARFPETPEPEVQEALAATDRAFREWRRTPLMLRADLVRRPGNLLLEKRDEPAQLVTLKMGKIITEARGEVEKSAGFRSFYAERTPGYLEPHRIEGGQDENWVSYDPVGPVFAVLLWNFPFVQVFRFAPALLMAGNTVVLKHASNVLRCALAMAGLFTEAGFPPDVFQTLLLSRKAVEGILANPRIRATTLTGSEGAGSAVAGAAGGALKHPVMELGGSDPFIVLDDADVAFAAAGGCRSCFSNNGQAYINAKRFIVLDAVADEFERALVENVRSLRVGDPLDPSTQVGSIAARRFVEDLHDQVGDSVAAGAKFLVGEPDAERPGAFIDPIVLSDVTPEMRVFREEMVGPAAAIIRVPTEEAAIELAHDSSYGLGASVWTRDTERGRRVAEQFEAGMVFINEAVVSDARPPFGGRKRSGDGRELGEWGIREFCEIKSIAISQSPTASTGDLAATWSGNRVRRERLTSGA